MPPPVTAALVVLGLAAGVWLARDLRALPRDRADRVDRVDRAAHPDVRPVSVIIPARDEEASLPAVLRAVGALRPAPGEVVVVDDGSRDRTAEVARAGGARVVAPGEPPPGWTGKAWACHVGAAQACGELLLFLDADTVLAPDALSALLEARDRAGGLVSVQPFHTVSRPYEQLSAYFNAVSVLASGSFRRRPTGRAMAFGPCLLTSRADYERAGGHAAVRGEVLDDARLARAYQQAGLPVWCATGARAVTMRSYPGGLRELIGGWTKNVASGAADAPPGPAVATVAWIGVHHAVAVGAATALVDHDGWEPWALAWVLVAGQLGWLLRRLGSFRWWTWVLFPLPLAFFDLVFVRSLVSTALRRSVRWRGRAVRVGGA
ncbi:glycosyltransferase [Nocardioides sp. BP30]|uniref:glycosyltransferase n=1 Tax=Nocardioides sp. BP30 TaxID=3036374 RepID=UPI00246829C4|nr:glycosyltransferase [Nocardioides sp. BP30]WGL52608.1 glycosyltransferase [Nocardioides sp. BP30]